MKTFTKCLVFVGLCLTVGQSFADDVCIKSAASMNCGAGTVSSIDFKGNAMLNQTIVQGLTHVIGTLNTNAATLNGLQVTGSVNLNSTTVSGSTKLIGALYAAGSSFAEKMIITAGKIYFDGTQTSDISVLGNGDPQVICLNNQSQVNGSIQFASGHGEVYLNGNSHISGSVLGGKTFENIACSA